MSKINWYVGMPVYIIGYEDCKVTSVLPAHKLARSSYPIDITGRGKNGTIEVTCTLDGRTCVQMTTQNVFFEPIEIPESFKLPQRRRAGYGVTYFYLELNENGINIRETKEINNMTDNILYKQGNYFRTVDEARDKRDKTIAVLKEGINE